MTIQPSLVVERATTSPVAQFVAKGSAAVAFSEYVLQAGSYLEVELTSVRVWAQGQPRNSNPLTRPQDYLRNVQVVDASTGAVLGTLATMTLSGSDMYQDYAYGDVALASPLTIQAGRQVTLTLRADVSATAINGYQYRLGLRYWSDPVAREALSDQRLTIKWPFAISSWGNWMTVSNLSATPTPTSTPTSTPTPVVVPKPRFQVTLGRNTSYAWVRDLTLTITALNADGSVNTGYTGKIDINPTLSLSGLSLNPGYWEDYTFTAANQGQVTFSQFGASVAGTLAVTVVDRADNSMTGTSSSVQVRPVYLAASFSPPRIHAGVPGLTLTIQALDAPGGNLVTGYRGELDINPPVGKTGLPQSASMYDPDYAFQATDGGQKHFPNLIFYLDGTHQVAVIDRATTSQRVSAAASIAPIYYDVQVTPGNTTATLTENSMTIRVLDAPGGAPVSGYRGGIEMDSNLVLKNLVANPWSPDYTFKATDGGQVRFDAFGFKNGGLGTVTVTDSDVVTRTGTSNTVDVEELHFAVVMGSLTTTVGVPQTMTVQVLDESNRLVPSYRGKVWLRSSDPKAALPDESVLGGADFTFKPGEGGQHTFNDVRFNTAGNQTITIEDADYAPRQTTGATVAAGAIHYDVVLTPALVGMGDPVTLTVRVLDESETPVAGYRNHVCLATTDPNASLPDEYVLGCTDYTFKASDAGVHTFYPVRFNNAGTYSVTVENSANPVYRGASNPITVKSVTLHAAVSPTTAFTGERPLALTVEARDADGNLVPEYRGAIVFEPSAASVGLPRGSYQFPDYTFTAADAGRHVFPNVGFNVAGPQSVTVRDTRNSNWRATSNAVTVNEVSFVTSITPTTVIAGDPVTLSVTVVDPATDATVTGYLGTIGLSTTLPSSYNQNYEFTSSNNGSAALSFSFGAGGAAQVSVYDLSYQPRRSAPTGVTVTPPPPPSPAPAGPAPAPYSIPENTTRPSPVDPGWGLPIMASKTYGSNEWRAFPPAAAVPATPGVRYLVSGSAMRVTDAPWWSTFYACPWLAWESSLTTSRPSGGGLNTPNYDPTASGFGLHACSGSISRDASWLWPSLSDPAPAGTQGVHLDVHTGGNSGGTFGFSAIPFGDERECDECNPAALGESLSVGDPIDTRTGEFYLTEPDLRVQTAQQGDGLRFERSYNTLAFEDGALGVGWTHTYNRAVKTLSGGFVTVRLAHGSYLLFKDAGGDVYAAAPGSRYALLKRPEGGWALVTTERQVDLFDAQGRLLAQQDPNGNLVWMTYQSYSRNGETGTRLARVDAPGGRHLWLGYDYYKPTRLIQVADHSGRLVRYGYDQNGFLAVITDTLGGVSRYSYSGWLMVSKVDAAGATVFANDYDGASRVITQTNSLGQRLSLSYVTAADGITTTVRDQTGATTVYAYGTDGLLRRVIDPVGATTTYRNYTAARVPTEIVDALGNVTRIAYDALAYPVVITDALGYRTSFAYDSWSRPTAITDTLGRSFRFTYTGSHLVTTQDPAGHTVHLEYADQTGWQGLLTAVTNQAGVTSTLRYNFSGDPVSTTDGLGNTTEMGYDELGRPVAIRDARGFTTTLTYDVADRVRQVTDPLGQRIEYEYDSSGNLVRTTDQVGATTIITYTRGALPIAVSDGEGGAVRIGYDTLGRPVTLTDQLGQVSSIRYDLAGRVVEQVDPLGNSTRYGYDRLGNLTVVTDARGFGSYFRYDALGQLVATTDAAGHTTRVEYDGVGNQSVITDALGFATQFQYDSLNRVVAVRDPLAQLTRFGYDAIGNQTVITDALGFATRYQYDALNQVVKIIDPLEQVTRLTYDGAGNQAAVMDARGFITRYSYDGANRLVAITDALTQTTQFAYDAAGRQTMVTNAVGITSTATYDRAGRVTATTDGLGRRTRYAYDDAGQLVRRTDPAGVVTAYEYDALGRLAAVVENWRPPYAADHETNVRTEYGYDANGNLLTVKDANGHVTRYAYDARNRPIHVTDPLSNTRQMSYTPRGELATTVDALNRTTSYEYNPVGALSRIERPDESVWFQYDALMRHTAMTDTLGVTRFSYDPLGRVTAVLDPFNQQVGYGYDAAGNRTSLAYPGNRSASYAYDGLNRLIQVTDWQNQVTSYSYDAANRLATALLPNGVTSSYSYDAANQLTSIEHGQASTLLARFAYSYDDAGNRLTAAEILAGAATSISYGYDPLSRLISATATGGNSYTESYSYDAAGNRAQQTVNGATTNYSYDAANRLTQAGAAIYTWDANGNLLGDGSRSYTYDSADRLTSLTQGTNSYSFAYNGLGNRLQQTVGGVTTNYLLDLNADLSQVLADGTATYLYGNGRIGAQQASGWSYYHGDALGSVPLLTNATGQPSGQASYTPFGEKLAGSSLVSTFGFTGEQIDPSGLVYLRARYYDPAQGRFITRDPFAGWQELPYSLHPYQYAYSNPLIYSDPSGQWVESALDIAGIAYDLYDIAENGLNWENGLSLAADVGGLILPGVTGGGLVVRAIMRADEAATVVRHADEAAEVVSHVDEAFDTIERFYHGTDCDSARSILDKGIDLAYGRFNLDFNPAGRRGFYVTKDFAQAQRWAVRQAQRVGKLPSIVEFAVPRSQLRRLNGKVFVKDTAEWVETVVNGRKGALRHAFDYVEGPMVINKAMGKVRRGLERPQPGGHQLAIFTQRAVDLFNRSIVR